MTALVGLLLLLVMHWLAGFGLLTILKIRLPFWLHLSLGILLGMGLHSFVPFLLQLFYVPITALSVGLTIILSSGLLNIHWTRGWTELRKSWSGIRFRIRIPEIPIWIVVLLLVLISIWRCYYLPPTPRDLTSGAEAVAEYAIHEKTLINSVFTVNLESTNNPFKPPYITSLQVIYKYAGFPFGQVWLSILYIAFLLFLHQLIVQRLHRLLAGLLLIFFICIPEVYAYSFMALFDLPNAMYFCIALYFLFRYFHSARKNDIILSGVLMAIATYIRSETLILIFLFLPAFLMHFRKRSAGMQRIGGALAFFLLPAAFTYLLSVTIYIGQYLPVQYEVQNLLRPEIWNPAPFFSRFFEMNEQLIFGKDAIQYYGYFFVFFVAVLLVDAIWREGWNVYSLNWLYAVLVVYIGLPLIAHLFPLYDLHHSTKRGLFKIFPLMVMYIGHSRVMRFVSVRLSKWENI